MISISHKGDFRKTERFLRRASKSRDYTFLDKYGQEGVDALSIATPKNTGKTSESWEYSIERRPGIVRIVWRNTNVVNGVPVAILLQYGHGTNNGGYVEGIDYINPALKPLFDRMASDAWREVTGP